MLAACSPTTAASGTEPAGANEPAAIQPALWRVTDADTTIYLFGTVHILPPSLDWETPAILDAFNRADAVYFETPVEPDMTELQRLVALLGFYVPPDRLWDRMSEADAARVQDAAAKLNLRIDLGAMRPWLAALTLSDAFVVAAGYDSGSGVERTLGPQAAAAGKTMRYFETIEQQLRFFADLSDEVQLAYLLDGVRQINEEPELLDQLVAAWSTGDVATLDRLVVEDEMDSAPEVYDAILVQRNRRWADTLSSLASEEAGVFFVAVGAAHIAGPESLALLVQQKGLRVERIQ